MDGLRNDSNELFFSNIQLRSVHVSVLPPESLCPGGGAAEIGGLARGRHSTAPACCRECGEDS